MLLDMCKTLYSLQAAFYTQSFHTLADSSSETLVIVCHLREGEGRVGDHRQSY